MLLKTTVEKYEELIKHPASTTKTIIEQNLRQLDFLKEFILTTPREHYNWYINDRNNFVTIFLINGESFTINGINKTMLIDLFKRCDTELGINLYDVHFNNCKRLRRYYYE